MISEKNGTPKSIEVIEVIKVVVERGIGTKSDPSRHVIQYWDKDGSYLAEQDDIQKNCRDFEMK